MFYQAFLKDKNTAYILFVILFLALFVRLVFTYFIIGFNDFYAADERSYNILGVHLARGLGYTLDGIHSTSYVAPIFPLFLAVIYKICGCSLIAARISVIILSSLSCLLGYLVSFRLFQHQKLGLLTALIMAFHPYLALLGGCLLTETLYTFILLTAILYLVKTRDNDSLFNCLVCGFMLGLCTLTRGLVLLLPPFILFWCWFTWRDKWQGFKTACWIILFMGLTLIPWTIRNIRVHHRFVPIATTGGIVFWGGNNPALFEHPEELGYFFLPDELRIKESLPEAELDRRYYQLALNFIKEHPLKFLRLMYHKFIVFWRPGFFTTPRNKLISLLYGFCFLPLVAVGLLRMRLRLKDSLIIYLLILFFILTALIFIGQEKPSMIRYRVGLEPYLSMACAMGLICLWDEIKGKKANR